MKHIKLFEKFESKEITSILSFLKKKINVGDFSYNAFLKYLKADCNEFDIPASSLSSIRYLKRNDALSIRGEANNQFGIIAIMYWFSATMGYAMTSYLGNDNELYSDRNLRYRLNMDSIKSGDFALVIELDDILIDMYDNDTKLSDIRTNRGDIRKGATALLSSKQAREINIERYISKLYSKFGIDENDMNLKNLNQLVISLIKPKSLMYHLYVNADKVYKLEQFVNDLYNFVLYKDVYYYNSSKSLYKRSKKEEDRVQIFKSKKSEHNKYWSKKVESVLSILDNICEKMHDRILSKRIQSVSDMHLISRKLEMLEGVIHSDSSDYKISRELENFLRLIIRGADQEAFDRLNYTVKDSDIKALERLYEDLDEIL